jgi:acyl-CoA hydrolase
MQKSFMTENNLHENRRSIVMAEIMTPDRVNFHGNIHGGHVLGLLDRVAYVCAARYAGKNVVTLSVDQVVFKEPIYVGELVTFCASVNYVGTSSMEVGIRVLAENLMTSQSRHTNTCYFTMVAVDEKGKPCKVSPLPLLDETHKRRYQEAILRKEARLKTHRI